MFSFKKLLAFGNEESGVRPAGNKPRHTVHVLLIYLLTRESIAMGQQSLPNTLTPEGSSNEEVSSRLQAASPQG